MPLVALNEFRSHISSKYFYVYGKKSAANVYRILFTSIFVICFISYPVFIKYTFPISQDPNDFIDAHVWQFSSHIHATQNIPPAACQYSAQQIHIEIDQNHISKDLLLNTLSLYQVLTTSYITWQGQFISLQDICATTPEGTCLFLSPLTYWDMSKKLIEQDMRYIETVSSNLHNSELLRHPYATMGNVTQSTNYQFLSADSLIFTILLKHTANSVSQWDMLWEQTLQQFNFTVNKLNVPNTVLQYKLKILPTLTYHTLILVILSIGVFFLTKKQFGKSNLIKSKSGLCITTLFLSCACYTTTLGIFNFFHLNLQVKPWFLQILVCTTATLEHALLLTWAVISRERGIGVKERIGRGLQQVGILMTSTLIGELIVLAIGSTMRGANVKSFCIFTCVALVITYVLNLTLFVAVLSIDIRRAELRDLSNDDPKAMKTSYEQYCQRFKSKRAFNAFILCIILLYLGLFFAETDMPMQDQFKLDQLVSISNRFWQVLNPSYDTVYLNIQPPYIIQLSNDTLTNQLRLNHIATDYSHKLSTFVTNTLRDDQFDLLDYLNTALVSLLNINVPGVLIFVIMVGILMWMTPYIREQALLPILRTLFVKLVTFILGIISSMAPVKTHSIIRRAEYNEEGIHLGAISLQSQFNKMQNQNAVRNIHVRTLIGKHISDIRQLEASLNLIVSIDQDHRIILWNYKQAEPIARLDKVKMIKGHWVAEKRNDGQGESRHLLRARCVALDPKENYVTAGFEDGVIRVWNIRNLRLIHELCTNTLIQNGLIRHNRNHQTKDRVIKIVCLDHTVLSIHKSGLLNEWDIETGDRVQSIDSGHIKEITSIQVLSNYIFTASKDGVLKGWERSNTFQGTSQWKLLYTIVGHDGHSITSLATQQLKNGLGIVVTGSSNGSVKVWNSYSGEAICTLSKGAIIKKKENPQDQIGGPLLQFSKVIQANHIQQEHIASDHTNAVSQVVITPIGNPRFENDQCPNCHNEINSGFFIASCSLDETVLVWRLDRTQIGKEIGCIQCTKDYHRQNNTRSIRRNLHDDKSPISTLRLQHKKKKSTIYPSIESGDLTLKPLFLGKINQSSGRGIVFCEDMVLAGIRRTKRHSIKQDMWEAWFVCLQYYEPPSLEEETFLIPVITHGLNVSKDKTEINETPASLWNQFVYSKFSFKKALSTDDSNQRKNTKRGNEVTLEQEEDVDTKEEDAYDVLPFSTIKCLTTIDGYGLGCDYGNFVKIISFDDPSKKIKKS